MPRLLREVKPNYTTDAMRAKISGEVVLECVVNTKGEATDIKILRSLDATFGLDQEAIKAARQWRFSPGTRLGEPVPVFNVARTCLATTLAGIATRLTRQRCNCVAACEVV